MTEPILIAGELVEGSGEPIHLENPKDGSACGIYSTASLGDLDRALQSSNGASDSWSNIFPHERARYLYKVAELVDRDSEKLANLQMHQNGKTITECRAQSKSCAAIFRYFAGVCETQEGAVTTPRSNNISMTIHEPYGLVGLITPWNSPLTMDAQKLAPAIAAGNTVLLKPAEVTPGVGLALGKLCVEAGIPPKLINVLNGNGSQLGSAIVSHPDVAMVSFTGGTSTGKKIAHLAAEKLMPVALELGGKSPNIVFQDANIDEALIGVSSGIFSSTGQSCVAGSRLFVQENIYEEFLDRLINIAESYKIGDPGCESTEIGPLATFRQRKIVEDYIYSATDNGGKILAGGSRPEGLENGAFFEPTILGDIDPRSKIFQEEVFGPVLIILPFKEEEELISLANNSVYGLACGIWTNDMKKAWRVAKSIKAGTVWINTYKLLSIANPFGGTKESGLGREKGREGLGLYQEQKTVVFSI